MMCRGEKGERVKSDSWVSGVSPWVGGVPFSELGKTGGRERGSTLVLMEETGR